MKTIRLLLWGVAAAFLCVGCDSLVSTAEIVVLDKDDMTFASGAGTGTFSVTASADWKIIIVDKWLSANPAEGGASEAAQTVTVAVEENTAGEKRVADILVKAGDICRTVTVTQSAAENGPEEGSGDGSGDSSGDGSGDNTGGEGGGGSGDSGPGGEGGGNEGNTNPGLGTEEFGGTGDKLEW